MFNSTHINECVYIHSFLRARSARCGRRKAYWATIHASRAKALQKTNLMA